MERLMHYSVASSERLPVHALVKTQKVAEASRITAKSSEKPRFDAALQDQLRVWRYGEGVADFYKSAARLVVAQLGNPARM